eukprot:GHRR01003752.1.p2 GENE.GHRR01003752.1~~GHRR01003752.1.p2  ORF type:complete len:312 (+),score=90.77 GHRR01003752.1:229-1164(+)
MLQALSRSLHPLLPQLELAVCARGFRNTRALTTAAKDDESFQGAGPAPPGTTSPGSSIAASTGPSEQSAYQQPSYAGTPKLVVFGGRGFVGSAICKEALKTGLHVVSISPAGTPPIGREAWTQDVEWCRGNALEPRTYQDILHGSLAAISCIGAFGSQAQMLKINGTANSVAIATAKAAEVPRFVYISGHIPNIPGLELVAQGYVHGKRQAEEELFRSYPEAGVALRPWVIYGDRAVTSAVTLPLGMMLGPVEYLIKQIPNARTLAGLPIIGAGFIPPVHVDQVAKAAVAAATDPTIPAGVIDNWRIAEWR